MTKSQPEAATEHLGGLRSQTSTDKLVNNETPSTAYPTAEGIARVKRPAIPPRDPSLSSFRLEDFASVCRRDIPTIYEKITSRSSYIIAPKTYRSHSGILRGVPMLQIGALSDTSSSLTVWARSNGEDLEYYGGREPSDIVVELQSALVAQMRYAKPFGDLGSSKGAIQALIHFLFLNSGTIDKLSTRNDVMLQFKEACRILNTHQSEAKEATRDKIETELKTIGAHAPSIGQDAPEQEAKSNQFAVKPGNGDTPTNQNRVRLGERAEGESHSQIDMPASSVYDRHESVPSSTPRASSKSIVPSLFDHIKTFEEQLRAALGQDAAILEEEVQSLKIQLEAHKERANNAKIRLDDERETREAAQEDLKKAQHKMREQEEIRLRLEEERDAHEAKSQDWQKKYAGLKRKLKSLVEDDDEPADRSVKH